MPDEGGLGSAAVSPGKKYRLYLFDHVNNTLKDPILKSIWIDNFYGSPSDQKPHLTPALPGLIISYRVVECF